MAMESPLFQSSMELLGHSISHFNASKELDRKLVILHLANAVELILKDLVLDFGESIYKSPKETITLHKCINVLKDKDINIPFLNRIELLIDERNALQHRFGSPNELTTIFYMNIAVEFFKDILKEHYDQLFDEIITQFADDKELMAYRIREPSNDTELDNLKKLSKVHPLGALLSAMTYLEKKVIEFSQEVDPNRLVRKKYMLINQPHHFLGRFDVDVPGLLRKKMDDVRRIRNLAAHGRKEPKEEEVKRVITTIEEFEKILNNVDVEAFKQSISEYLQRKEKLKKQKLIQPLLLDDNDLLYS
ncbi:MAG: hypothetical protein GY804_12145 [Alphaproteobacteria bacterium]|nr:hypothetical protein [Alphaproteobacteria bacterium]